MAITRDEADRLLATIGAVYDRLATAMYAVDSHPTLTYLRAAMYTGRTNQMREAVLFDVGVMWAQFTTIGDILEQARALRTQFRPSDARWIDLDRLLAGPVIAVDCRWVGPFTRRYADESTHRRVQAAWRALAAEPLPGVSETVPAYTSVTLFYAIAQHRLMATRTFVRSDLSGSERRDRDCIVKSSVALCDHAR